jgi:glucose/arabinose dehydrogenase
MSRIAFFAAFAALLAGCASQQSAPVARAPQQRPPAAQAQRAPQPPPQRAPSHAVAEPGEAVWHLRAGLNVAALSCRGRGRVSVAGAYSQLLSRHRGLLAAAYAGEQKRYGKGLDRHLTQIYNRFAFQPSPGKFCTDAAAVASEAVRMDSATLSGQAKRLLGRLG